MLRRLGSFAILLAVACSEGGVHSGDAGGAPDASVPDAGTPTPDSGPPADRDGFIQWEMEAGHIPGLAVAVIREGAVAWVGTYGFADLDAQTPIDEHTLFIVASVSKTITLTRVLQLSEQGMLDLDAPADTIAPYAIRHPMFPDDAISTRMLLCHVSGIVDANLELAAASSSGDPTITLDEFGSGYVTAGGRFYSDGNFGAQPATTSSYCNACLGIVGSLVEHAGGAEFREQTRTNIFEPLAMDGAGWFLADVDPTHLAVPYGWSARRYYVETLTGYAFYPAGTLRVSLTGLTRFVLMWLGEGELDGVRVLQPETVQAAFMIQYPRIDRGQALTFRTHRVGTHVYLGHSGSTFGGAAQMLFDPVQRSGIVLLTNSDAYIRDLLGQPQGADAIDAILLRLDQETF